MVWIVFARPQVDTLGSQVKVYSMNSNSWKTVESFPYTQISRERAIPLNGAVYWTAEDNFMSNNVVALDLTIETFKVFSTPFTVVRYPEGVSLNELGGCLCLCVIHLFESCVVEVWRMDEYGVGIWSHFYNVTMNVAYNYFYWYDFVINTEEQVTILGLSRFFSAAICVANLGLLDDDLVISEDEGSKHNMSEDEGSEQDDMSADERFLQGNLSEDEKVLQDDDMSADEGFV
uniref:putative F-box protein At1g12855 n=1 Tax=Fragaria vesca subsp. vesca TaxID=101020 RepID=UPI0005C89C6B|nr:PREDICTED: putative F-box protein At1g12855 [Fragaria vesca subsp. vesca]